jgi:hypothetical protein
MATKQVLARKIILGLGGLVFLSLLFVTPAKAQEACLPTDKAELERIDRYILELQTDSAKLTAFLDKVLQHPQYAVIIEPIIATAAQRLETIDDADKEASLLLTEPDWARIKEIVCMLLRSPGATTAQTPTPPKQPTTPAEPAATIWFADDNLYHASGDVIAIPYYPKKHLLAFALHDDPTTTKVIQWSLIENNVDITPVVYTGESNQRQFGMNVGGRNSKMLLKAKYDNKEVVVELKIIKETFALKEAYALPKGKGKESRLAKAGQTLYFVDGNHVPGMREDADVMYWVTLSPGLSTDKYAPGDVAWSYNDQSAARLEELVLAEDIERNVLEEDAKITTTVSGGYPTVKTKQIHVQWVDGTIKSFAFVPPAVSAVLTKTFDTMGESLKLVDKVLVLGDKDSKNKLEFTLEPIKITGKLYNQEDPKSRLYREVKTGTIAASLKAKFPKKAFTHPVLKILEDWKVAECKLYFQADLAFALTGGMDMYKYAESAKEQGTKPFVEISGKGCAEAGGVAKLLVAKDVVDFEFKAYAQVCLALAAKWDFVSSVKIKASLPPVVLGLKAKFTTKTPFEFDLVDYNGSVSITDEWIIWEGQLP